MSHATDMRKKPLDVAPPPLNVEPRWNGGWAVHDGGDPVPLAEFATREEAVSFAHRLAHSRVEAGGQPREVVGHERPRYRTVTRGGITRFVPLDGSTPRPVFGSARGLLAMAPDFDAWWPEFEEEYGG